MTAPQKKKLEMLLRQCQRCGRWEYAKEGQKDTMPQPDGEPCGGRFGTQTRKEPWR